MAASIAFGMTSRQAVCLPLVGKQVARFTSMKPVSEIRRLRLRELVDQVGSQVAVADKLRKNKNQVYQWLLDPSQDGARNIGPTSARVIEAAFKMPHGWMDSDPAHSATLPPADRDFRQYRFTRLEASIIEPAVTMVRAMVTASLGSDAVFDPYGDVPLFVAAYDLMAEPSTETRDRFDTAMAARVAAHREEGDGAGCSGPDQVDDGRCG